MTDEKAVSEVDTGGDHVTSLTLRDTIRSGRELLNRTITTARAHSPLADDKLEAADGAISSVIHTGYQAVKNILVRGHPAIILSVTGIIAAAPSLPFGPRAAIRNAGLTMALATVMIYPDHLRVSSSAPKTGGREGEPS